ncbi:MAG: hypothetical protein FGM28_08185 [Limnohabitans sp.]|nr:hypothetical protein [Limnohabitans sp.]
MRVRYALQTPAAVQLATALDIGASALVTPDRDFSAVRGLPILSRSTEVSRHHRPRGAKPLHAFHPVV